MNQFDTDVNPDLMYLVEHACLAPSGGNSQPWRFVADETTLECYIDTERSASHINFRHLGSYVALGAATENMVLAPQACGLDVEFPRATSLHEPVCP